MNSAFYYLGLVAAMTISVVHSASAPAGNVEQLPAIRPTARIKFQGDVLEDRDLSGVAMAGGEQGLVVADEGAAVQTFRWDRDGGAMQIQQTISLIGALDEPDPELDLEGVAYADGAYYAVGSHGVAKKTGIVQQSRRQLFRIPVDAEGNVRARQSDQIARTSLTPLLSDDPLLSEYLGRPLQNRGLNIEGLAVRKGQLFIALRGPNIGGYSFIIETAAADLFDGPRFPGARATVAIHSVKLGPGYGIRDMAVVNGGFLLLLGNSAAEPDGAFHTSLDYDENRPFVAAFWDGYRRKVVRLARLEDPPGKAEALLVLGVNQQSYETLILFDGADRGDPGVYHIPVPAGAY